RDLERLNQNASKWRENFGVEVEVLVADLSRDEDIRRIELRLQNTSRPIEVLINNAGFGIKKSFLVSEISDEIALLDVLVTAPMRLMHAILPIMKARNSGVIINVSSIAGWIAGGTYSAAKSYLTVLTESLHTELLGSNVKLLSLAPGYTRTEFHQRGNMKMAGLPNWLWLTSERVVEDAWNSAQAGKVLCIPGRQYQVIANLARYAPRPWVRKLGMNLGSRRGRRK
ncbi:MAG: SDR family NAD(P)-dependent oxidoreductase, partial [Actinobacteria bacterium]|nr:SDR family NAD(P)-dependent oxidoreductase [Actinomycetota bacterium]